MKILLTGGTGSFGQAFVRAALYRADVEAITVFSRDEAKQEAMRLAFSDTRLRFVLGDVRDVDSIGGAMRHCDVVMHAAALKRVPFGEANPAEFVSTNVGGCRAIIAAASQSPGVKRVLALSSDKAVAPSTLYGATKMVAERLIMWADADMPGVALSCVRYGNVLGSRGSVVELWREQAKAGAITITNPQATRFWLTLCQAVEFVLSCLDSMCGGEIFVPKPPSSTVADLAAAVAPGCAWGVIGLRDTEKMHEVLVGEDESPFAADAGNRYIIRPHGEGGGPRFVFDSLTNPLRVGAAELRTLLEGGT